MRVAVVFFFACAVGLPIGCSSSTEASLSAEAPSSTKASSSTEASSTTDRPQPEPINANRVAKVGSATDRVHQPAVEEKVQRPTTSAAVMDEKTGVAIGQKVPSFNLKDATGQRRTLDEFLAGGNVALVFYRSADW